MAYQLADMLREERARADCLHELFSSSSGSLSSSLPVESCPHEVSGKGGGVGIPSGSGEAPPVCGYDCEESSRVPASCGCVECASLLCPVCEGLYGKLKRNKSHRVLPCGEYLSEMQKQKPSVPSVCSSHGFQLQLYCASCECLVCLACCALEHTPPKHDVKSLREA